MLYDAAAKESVIRITLSILCHAEQLSFEYLIFALLS